MSIDEIVQIEIQRWAFSSQNYNFLWDHSSRIRFETAFREIATAYKAGEYKEVPNYHPNGDIYADHLCKNCGNLKGKKKKKCELE